MGESTGPGRESQPCEDSWPTLLRIVLATVGTCVSCLPLVGESVSLNPVGWFVGILPGASVCTASAVGSFVCCVPLVGESVSLNPVGWSVASLAGGELGRFVLKIVRIDGATDGADEVEGGEPWFSSNIMAASHQESG